MRLILVAVVLLARCAVAQQISSPDAITRTAEEFRSAGHIPGIAVAVVQDGKITHALGLGLAEVDNNVPATDNQSLYRHRHPATHRTQPNAAG